MCNIINKRITGQFFFCPVFHVLFSAILLSDAFLDSHFKLAVIEL